MLVVIDQFEQWLHAKGNHDNSELVHALRQCDGGRLQCVAMVRDDFWMAVTRFLRNLEIRLIEDQNSAAVDLFDRRHAEKVLAAFGRAFGILPETMRELSEEQKQFLEQAVGGLAQDGKVICVRVALFAEMMKGRIWTPAALKEVGGTEGIGETFLEETFSANTAPPEHRYHQQAARAVLKALLPESGTDIKGNMRSSGELLEVSGYRARPRDFEDLIRILDGTVRLITPTDPEGAPQEARVESSAAPPDGGPAPLPLASRYYQLTHDYLVPSLREWLTRKQKETRRGRAELRLVERAAIWNSMPQRRHLPSPWEYVYIRLFTDRKKWTAPQRKMMRKAAWGYGRRLALSFAATAFVMSRIVVHSRETQDRENANTAQGLVQSLLAANTADVGTLIPEIDKYREWATPQLREVVDRRDSSDKQRINASLALLPVDAGQEDFIADRLRDAKVEDLPVMIALLQPHKDRLQPFLWETIKSGTSGRRLRAAAALAAYDPQNPQWQECAFSISDGLLSVSLGEANSWIGLFKPVGVQLAEPLKSRYRDRRANRDTERTVAAVALAAYLPNEPKVLTELALLADTEQQFLPFLDAIRSRKGAEIEQLRAMLNEAPPSFAVAGATDWFWKRQANTAALLLGLNSPEAVWPLFKHSADESTRSYLIDRLPKLGTDYQILANRLDQESDASARQALILALGDYDVRKLSSEERDRLGAKLMAAYRADPDAGVHSAAGWAMRHLQFEKKAAEIDGELRKTASKIDAGKRHWFLNSQGQTFLFVTAPIEFSRTTAAQRLARTPAKKAAISYRFAIATKKVTMREFHEFASHSEKI